MTERVQSPGEGASLTGAGRIFARMVRLMVLVSVTGALLAGVLALVRPQYGAEARLSIQMNRPAGMNGSDRRAPDAILLASQIEVLRSADLATRIVERNKLDENAEFNEVLAPLSPLKRFAILTNIVPDPATLPQKERVIRALLDRLNIGLVSDTGLVAVGVRAADAETAARLANDLAAAYSEWLTASAAGPATAPGAGLGEEVAVLRARIEERAARLAEMLTTQREQGMGGAAADEETKRLDLQSQLVLVRAKREDIDGKAKQVRAMLAAGGKLQRSGDLLNSGLIQRLIEREAALERKMSEASASLLPSHPQMKRLKGEMTELREQVRAEAEAVAAGLESEVTVALTREKALQDSLADLREGKGGSGTQAYSATQIDEVREALANDRRRLAQSEARLDVAMIVRRDEPGSLVATIVTRAHADHVPAFPRKLPVILGGMAVVLLFGIVRLWLELVFGWPRVERRRGDRRQTPREADAAMPAIKRPELLTPRDETGDAARA